MSKASRSRRRKKGLLPPPEKCLAHTRTGDPCKNPPILGSVVCRMHGGSAPQVRRKAQERIAMAQDDAASLLVRFMADKAVPYPERRRCAEFLLTYENRNEVQITLAKWEQDIEGILTDAGEDDIVDGEVVEDGPRAIPPSDAEWRTEVLTAEDSEPSIVRGNRYRGR